MRSSLGVLFVLLFSPLAHAVPLEGTVVDKDGKPATVAVVQVEPLSGHALSFLDLDRPEDSKTAALQVDSEGRFSQELPVGAFRVWFRAPGHRGLSTIVFVSGKEKALPGVKIALGRERAFEWIGTPSVQVKGKGRSAVEMKAEPDGTWSASVKCDEPEVRYVLSLKKRDGVEWLSNPGTAVVFDRAFYSVAEVKDGSATVRFDPKFLAPSGREEGEVTFAEPKSVQARIAALTREFERRRLEAHFATASLPRDQQSARMKQSDTEAAAVLAAAFQEVKAPRLYREVAAVLLVALWLEGTEAKALQQRAAAFVPATSWAWAAYPPATNGYVGTASFGASKWTVLSKLSTSNPDPNIRGGALYALAENAKREGREKEAARLRNQLLTTYADAPTVKWGLERESYQRSRVVGVDFPDLSLKTLEGKDVNAASMKGRPTLVEFSALGCGACTSLIPELQQLRERYSAEKLRMVTITLGTTPKSLEEILAKQPQPWEHVALEDSDEVYERFKQWEVWYYPTLFLVDENGKIAALDEELRKNNDLAANLTAVFERKR